MELVLSLFPGLDLLGAAFTEAGFSVVRGPDPLYNSRIRRLSHSRGRVTGIVAGPPCQDFSKARRCKPSGHGLRMLAELLRCIDESRPEWVLIENVPQIPGHPAPGLPSPAPGHCRLRVRGHAVKTAARPVPFAARSRNPPGTRAPPASSCGHSHVGNRCVVTHLCRDLPPPGFQRARHFARLVERGQSQGRRQRGAVVHRPRFGDRSVTTLRSGPSRLRLRLRPANHAAGPPGRPRLSQADGAPAEVDRRKNHLVSHT